jgi:tRNA (cytidine/uridine-2'-O-)-methyltransferase
MDYADICEILRHDDWQAFLKCHSGARIVLLTTKAKTSLWNFNFRNDDIILVGRESAGVPTAVAEKADESIVLPMPGGGRSLNVAMSAGLALGESLRQVGTWRE